MWEGAHQIVAHHGGGRQRGGDVGEVVGQGSPASIDGSSSSTWTRQCSWAGQLGWGVARGSRPWQGAQWRTEWAAPVLSGQFFAVTQLAEEDPWLTAALGARGLQRIAGMVARRRVAREEWEQR
jgi:hypothetical protein